MVTADKQKNFVEEQLEIVRELLKKLDYFLASQEDDYINIEAWSIFHVWQDRHLNIHAPYFSFFRAWQLFHWHPEPSTLALPLDESCHTIAEAYLRLNQISTEHEKNFVRSAVNTLPDIFEISSFDGPIVFATGIISKKKIRIYQPGLSKSIRSSDYLVGQSIPVDNGVHILLGSSPPIDRKAKILIADFRNFIESCDSTSVQFNIIESDFFNLFYDLLSRPDLMKVK